VRPKLLEVAASRRLLRQLAEGRDRNRPPHEAPVLNRVPLRIQCNPAANGAVERAKVDAKALLGLGRDHARDHLAGPCESLGESGEPLELGVQIHAQKSVSYDGVSMFRKQKTDDDLLADARRRLKEMVDAEAERREAELQHTLSVGRAETSAMLAQEHRRLADERRDELVRAEQRILTELTGRLIGAQKEIEGKLTAWAQDLERVREGLATQLARLEQRQRQLISDAEARFSAESERLLSDAEEHRTTLARLREEVKRQIKDTVDEATSELETHAAERRRALHEVGDRLRHRERALAEQIDREASDAVRKVSEAFADVERRLVEQVERSVNREATRLTEEAAVEFNSMIRSAREEAARRLARELDRSIDSFTRQAERLLAERLAAFGDTAGGKLERRYEGTISALERRFAQLEDAVREQVENLAGAAGGSSAS
jgi:uncharacterized protein YukE